VSAQAEPAAVGAALAQAADAGPFFRLEVLDGQATAGWRPVSGELSGLVARTASQLGTSEPRVAASILQLSLAARLWSPVLGSGLLAGLVPDLDALLIADSPPVRLGTTRLRGWRAAGTESLAALAAATVGRQLDALAGALPVQLAPGLLRGNSASAMIGALGVLVRSQPGLTGPACALADALLRRPELAGSGVLAGPGPAGLSFRRQSCCLYYRVPGGGLCGDCCLDYPPGPDRE
jgi:hypothetical protein